MCGDCIYYPICGQWVEESETFPEIEGGCKVFKSKADFVEVVKCAECKHLEIINKAPIYAKCMKHGIVFELWQEDTRENFCSFGERRKDNG